MNNNYARLMESIDSIKDKISDGEYLDLCTHLKTLYNVQEPNSSDRHLYRIEYVIPTIDTNKKTYKKELLVQPCYIVAYIGDELAFHINKEKGLGMNWNRGVNLDTLLLQYEVPQFCDCLNCNCLNCDCYNCDNVSECSNSNTKVRLFRATLLEASS